MAKSKTKPTKKPAKKGVGAGKGRAAGSKRAAKAKAKPRVSRKQQKRAPARSRAGPSSPLARTRGGGGSKSARSSTAGAASSKGGARSSKKGGVKIRPLGVPEQKPGGATAPDDDSAARNFGLRGAAPWVARHAAKHAEELRRRNAEPAPPGSARATLRIPEEADRIKSEVGELHQLTSKIRSLRKRLDKTFYEIGQVLDEVQVKGLHDAKGYSSFEAFLDREVDLPRTTSLRLIRIVHTFQRDTAYDFGLERLTMAIAALDGELTSAAPSHPSSRGFSSTALPHKPPIRWED